MQTILITRYNVPLKFETSSSNPMDPIWLNKREKLFRDYCLPSIKQQTNKSFVWAIGIHYNYTPEFLSDLPENAIIIKCKSSDDFTSQLKNLATNGTIISARLDSDDAIAANYIEKLRNFGTFFDLSPDIFPSLCALNFRTGCEFVTQERRFYNRDYPNSSFVAVFDRGHQKPAQLVTSFHHAHIHKSMPTCNIQTNEPMWCIGLHDNNVGNVLKGTLEESLAEKSVKLFGF